MKAELISPSIAAGDTVAVAIVGALFATLIRGITRLSSGIDGGAVGEEGEGLCLAAVPR